MRLSRTRQLAMLEDFALGLGDGLSPLECCRGLLENAKRFKLREEQHVAMHLMSQLNHGRRLGPALQKWFSPDLVMLVAVGEHSGILEQLLQQHRQFEQQRREAWRQFWKPLVYPLAMLALAFSASFFIGRGVMPKLAQSLPEAQWPQLSQWLLLLTHSVWLPLLLTTVVAVFLLSWGPTGLINFRWRWCQLLSRLGAFLIYRYFTAVLLLQTTTVLMQAGINLDRSFAAIQRYGGSSLGVHLTTMRQRLAQGERRLERIFDSGLLSARMLFRLGNGSRNATEQGTLLRVSGYAASDAVQALARLRTALQAFSYGLIFALLVVMLGGMGSMLMAITQQNVMLIFIKQRSVLCNLKKDLPSLKC